MEADQPEKEAQLVLISFQTGFVLAESNQGIFKSATVDGEVSGLTVIQSVWWILLLSLSYYDIKL